MGPSRFDRPVLVALAIAATIVGSALGFFVGKFSVPGGVAGPGETYYGAAVQRPGPALKGLPAIPVRVDPDGSLRGVPYHLSWYSYCSKQGAPGLREDYAGEERFVYHLRPERIAAMKTEGIVPWFEASLGHVVQAADFPTLGQGAPVQWRSEGAQGIDVLTAVVIRVDPSVYSEPFRSAFAPDGFVAFASPANFRCCVAGYQQTHNPLAKANDGHDLLLDSCHLNRWDPQDVRPYPLPALPE